MEKKRNMLFIHIGESIALFLIGFILYKTGHFLDVGHAYVSMLSIPIAYGILLAVKDKKDIRKDEMSVWFCTAVIPALVSFAMEIMWGKGMIYGIALGAEIWGINLTEIFVYRVRRHLNLFKLREHIVRILGVVAVLNIFEYIMVSFHWRQEIITVLLIYTATVYYALMLKWKKISF